jgi:exopolyphosphatase / guanosine-5'-triphosphate,3'-diphosphate pyrophosphatase
MRRACIDIGSNTTRLLVADIGDGQLRQVHEERAFTHLSRGLRQGTISPEKIAEVSDVVHAQVGRARALGCVEVRGVATAAIRRAGNGRELIDAIRAGCGLEIQVLSTGEEARLAFVGAAGTLGRIPTGELGVVDVGGGSCQIVVGEAPSQVHWSTSLMLGSSDLAKACLRSDPPSEAELSAARERISRMLSGVRAPRPAEVVAVGGSAASLCRLAGPVLDAPAFTRSLGLLASISADGLARRYGLEMDRVRLLPAALVILEAASERFGLPLEIGRGGIREGLLLEAADG